MINILALLFFLASCTSTPEVDGQVDHLINEPKINSNGAEYNTSLKKSNRFTIETNKFGQEELIQELNQNLNFYCMSKNKVSRFKGHEECQTFVKNALNDCEKNFKEVDRFLVKCVKKRLQIK